MAYSECRYRFFPELGIRESYMLISDSVESDQFRYLNRNDWLIACEALTTFSFLLVLTSFVATFVGMAKPKLNQNVIDWIFYLSIGIASFSTGVTCALYMYKMFERCSFAYESDCWIGYSFGFGVASAGFGIIAIFIRFLERRGLCCNEGDTDSSFPITQFEMQQQNHPPSTAPSTSKLVQGTPPPGYPMSTWSQKTVCTEI